MYDPKSIAFTQQLSKAETSLKNYRQRGGGGGNNGKKFDKHKKRKNTQGHVNHDWNFTGLK